MSTGWSLLIVAGLLEIVWAVGLKYTDSFTRGEPRGAGRLVAISTIICGIVGLRLASPQE
jgi:quaternary ammonium compound-resistance protein SugE